MPSAASITPTKVLYGAMTPYSVTVTIHGHSPCIGENGNWYEWDDDAGEYIDTGVSTQTEVELVVDRI